MKIPNCENAVIPLNKIINYLLSPTHTVGKTKANFFLSIGFNKINLEIMFRQHIMENEVAEELETNFGKKYIVKGNIIAPNGRKYKLSTIWIIESNKRNPYFVTAYPTK